LGCLEAALRLVGYGYPTSFFLRTRIDGRDCFVPNPEFTYRFFSSAQSRPAVPIRMAADKSTNTYRVFVFGESAAAGDPDSSYGVSRYLQVLLQERFPGTDFEVLCVAVTGISSHTILPIARECAAHDGDLWVVYMGNNEMVGPFGAETVFGARAPRLAVARAVLAAKATRTGELLNAIADRLRLQSPSPESGAGMDIGLRRNASASSSHKAWGGMQMFAKNRLRHDDPARLRVYENFKGNLDDILATGHRAGVPVILSTVAVNLRDFPPLASLHRAGLSESELASWDKLYQEGMALETAGTCRDALARYEEAARIDADYADLQFRMGTCELALTNDAQARRHFELATDCDALAFRTDTKLNQAIKAAAARRAGQDVCLVDAAEVLSQKSPAGIPGMNFFYEHVHPNFAGNYLLALSFAEQARKLLPESIKARDKGNWASPELCDGRLAATVWDRQRVWQPIFNRIAAPPFTGQSDHDAFFKRCEAKLDEAKALMSLQTPEQARRIYEEAVTRAPRDYFLHVNFSRFLEAAGDLAGAVTEAQRLCELAPYLPEPCQYTGVRLVQLGRSREAEDYFARAAAIKPDYAEAHNELGLIAAGQGQAAKAVDCFNRALKADPDLADACVNLGFLEQRQGRIDRALACYDRAARLQPQGPPDYLYRAVSLTAANRSAEAISCFQTLVQQVPAFWQAHYLFGMELVAAGRKDEAQAQFAEVLHYRPDWAQALSLAPAQPIKRSQATP